MNTHLTAINAELQMSTNNADEGADIAVSTRMTES
jgi:hypothetical protein